VVDTLEVIDQAIEEIKQSTVAATPDLTSITLADMGWVKELLGRFTMSEMRERFVAQIIDGKPVEWSENGSDSAGSSSSGSAELF
jgi:methyl-accepting chemotaxis protein